MQQSECSEIKDWGTFFLFFVDTNDKQVNHFKGLMSYI